MQAMQQSRWRGESPGYTPRLKSDSRVMVLLLPLESAQLNHHTLAAVDQSQALYQAATIHDITQLLARLHGNNCLRLSSWASLSSTIIDNLRACDPSA